MDIATVFNYGYFAGPIFGRDAREIVLERYVISIV
jgi:hypothetical protein